MCWPYTTTCRLAWRPPTTSSQVRGQYRHTCQLHGPTLHEVRRGTVTLVKKVDQEILGWEGPDGHKNAIGSLLFRFRAYPKTSAARNVIQAQVKCSMAK